MWKTTTAIPRVRTVRGLIHRPGPCGDFVIIGSAAAFPRSAILIANPHVLQVFHAGGASGSLLIWKPDEALLCRDSRTESPTCTFRSSLREEAKRFLP